MCYIEEYGPCGDMLSPCLYEMIVYSMECQGYSFQIHKHTHNDMYTVDFVPASF